MSKQPTKNRPKDISSEIQKYKFLSQKIKTFGIKLFQPSVVLHIEISHLFWREK